MKRLTFRVSWVGVSVVMSHPARIHVTVRYERYKAVLDQIVDRSAFSLTDIQQTCHQERPAFITRLLNELMTNGWLVREEHASIEQYRWNPGRGSFSIDQWLHAKLSGDQIRNTPQGDRPRERLMANGPEQLRLAELLAILIRSGRPGESAISAGEKLAREYQHRLQDLPAAGRSELQSLSSAVNITAWCQIMAGIELGRRVANATSFAMPERITSSAAALEFCQRHFHRLATDGRQEEFHIVTLNTKHQVIDTHQITVGTLDASLIHPREVFRPAIKDAAAAVILVHNHPSGDPTPSREDLTVTRQLEQAAKTLEIKLLDHIVVGARACISIREYQEDRHVPRNVTPLE